MKLFWFTLLFLIGTFIYYLFNPTIERLNISGQEHQRSFDPSTGTYSYRSDNVISRPTEPAKELKTHSINYESGARQYIKIKLKNGDNTYLPSRNHVVDTGSSCLIYPYKLDILNADGTSKDENLYRVIKKTTTPFDASAWLVIGDITLVDYTEEYNTLTLRNVVFFVTDAVSIFSSIFGIGNTGYSYSNPVIEMDLWYRCGPLVLDPRPGPEQYNYLDRNLWSSIINYYSYVKIELNNSSSYGKIKEGKKGDDDNNCKGIKWIKLISNAITTINVKNVRINNQYTGGDSNFWYNNNHNEDNNKMLIDTGNHDMNIRTGQFRNSFCITVSKRYLP